MTIVWRPWEEIELEEFEMWIVLEKVLYKK